MRIQIPEAFEPLFQPSRFKAFHSGRGAAKSHSFAAALVVLAYQRSKRIFCGREIQDSIKDSVKRLLDDKIESSGLKDFYDSTKDEIRGANGSLFTFGGLRHNIDKIKSMEGVDIAWIEEANRVSQDSLNKLTPTIRKPGSEIWFSWNPEHPNDPVDHMFLGKGTLKAGEKWEAPPDSIIRGVSWRDNPWFPDVLRSEMEWDRRRDPDKWAHIWEGGYLRNSEARVFKNWRVGSQEEFQPKPDTRFYYGGDWGFSVDPSVLVRCYFEGRTVFFDYEAYQVGCDIDFTPFLFGGADKLELIRLNGDAFKKLLKMKGCAADVDALFFEYSKDPKDPAKGEPLVELGRKWLSEWPGVSDAAKWPIRADSARPETIRYMQQHGFPRIVAAKKGPGSVEDGVEFLKTFDIVVHPRCTHLIDELTMYSWKVDPLTGQVLPILEDKKNHVIDSARYALEDARRPTWGLA